MQSAQSLPGKRAASVRVLEVSFLTWPALLIQNEPAKSGNQLVRISYLIPVRRDKKQKFDSASRRLDLPLVPHISFNAVSQWPFQGYSFW